MLQAHSFLWNYLWVAPNLFLLALGALVWRRGLSRQVPSFLPYALLSATLGLARFIADIAPWVSAENYWRFSWGAFIVEGVLEFIVIGEIFSRILNSYSSLARLGKIGISGFGATLVLLATLAGALSRDANPSPLIAGFHVLVETVNIVALGLTVFTVLFVAYFRLTWDRLSFAILLGFGLASCVYLTTWAILANTKLSDHGRTLLDFVNFATYHSYVLLWFYYVLVPSRVAPRVAALVPEHNLELWNRELERLLQL